MKKTFILFFLLLCLSDQLLSQVADDFTDGDFLVNPAWQGDTSQFGINASNQLQLISSGADTSVLVTRNNLILNCEWDFWIRLSFNSSANNYARLYLASDSNDIKSEVNGYFLKIGGSDDSIRLFRQDGMLVTPLITACSTTLDHSVNILRIKIIRDENDTWRLYVDPKGGFDFIEEGSARDEMINYSDWTGIYCKYTSSNSARFYFDDFYIGPVIKDTIPPEIVSLRITADRTLKLEFSEATDPLFTLDPSNYRTRKDLVPVSVSADTSDKKAVTLLFAESFDEKYPDTLFVLNCQDLEGNEAGPLTAPFCYYAPKCFDIIINEIMADPEPSNGLPGNEYVELFNRTGIPICLNNWRFEWNTGSKTFQDITVDPYSYLILTSDTSFNAYGQAVPLFTSSSTLSNEGSSLVLKNEHGKIVHSVTYSGTWINDPVKAEGGWSLEMKDPMNPCGCEDNWAVCSYQAGGTPGSVNSVNTLNPDTAKPHIDRAYPVNNTTVNVVFSEPMDSTTLMNKDAWKLSPGEISPDSISIFSPEFSELNLYFHSEFQKGTNYTLVFTGGAADCAGNQADSSDNITIAMPDSVVNNDVIFNEVLFNPYPDGFRFAELYNLSNKALNLADLSIASFDTTTGSISDKVRLTCKNYLFYPGEYIVLTENPNDIKSRYNAPDSDAFLTMASLPAMNDHSGNLMLIRTSDDLIIDEMQYSETMQLPFLADKEGVSLEKINPLEKSTDPVSWHSASESSGFATPGYMNSQYYNSQVGNSVINVDNPVFSPDNDGREDLLNFSLAPAGTGYIANIYIFDSRGRGVRTLIRNRLISSEDSFSWDGADDYNAKAPIGIYILCVELFQPAGKTIREKKAIVLAGKF